MVSTVDFVDQETGSPAFVTIRQDQSWLAIGLGVEGNGDLDLVVSLADARAIAQALLSAAETR